MKSGKILYPRTGSEQAERKGCNYSLHDDMNALFMS